MIFRSDEITLCKDCKYYQDNNGGYPHESCKWKTDETPDPDNYCSMGEREICAPIPVEWIKKYASDKATSEKAANDFIHYYWEFWEEDILKMISDWEKENGK